MNRKHQLNELESLLRRIKPTAAVRESHKRELRQRLLAPPESKFSFSPRWVYAGAVIVLLIGLAVYSWKPTPAIGVLAQNGKEHPIHNQRKYEINEPATIRLADSELQVTPGSRITIDTTYVYSDKHEIASNVPAHTVMQLHEGSLDIQVQKRTDGQTYWVETPDARVQVTGTRFQVTVEME